MYNETYVNNHIYGSPCKPVILCKLEEGHHCGEEINILVANREFFEELKCGCDDDFRRFSCVFAFCAPFGNCKSVYIKNGECGELIPLRSSCGGFTIKLDQIQYLCNARKLVCLANCYDKHNNHINVLSPVYPKHKKCYCDCGHNSNDLLTASASDN